MVGHEGIVRGSPGNNIRGLGRLHTLSMGASIPGGRSTIVTEEYENLANLEYEGIVATETDDLAVRPSGSQPALSQESLV